MRTIILAALLASSVVLVPYSASAAIIIRGFNIDFVDGLLAGQNFMGELSYDDDGLSGVGNESLTPRAGGGDFLSFDVTIAPATFIIDEDVLFPQFPELFFLAGEPVELDYDGIDTATGNRLTIGRNSDVLYEVVDMGESSGTFSFKPLSAIPEPTTLALFAFGLLGAGIARRHRSNKAQ